MAISQLSLTDFRNLAGTTLDFHPRLNLIYGSNGSGKTSLLEAIYVLCQAASFRGHQLGPCVKHGQAGFLLFGRFDNFKAGVGNVGRRLQIRIDGEPVSRRSDLVRRAPVNLVNAETFALLDGPPQRRRRFLDWILFHVEHEYADRWVEFQHALRQRNRLLKSRRDQDLISYWDGALIEPSMVLSDMRHRYCDRVAELLHGEMKNLVGDLPLELAYVPGWRGELADQMRSSRARDIKMGHTTVGIHRDELQLTTGGQPVAEVLSRGQSKRLCIALIFASLKIVAESTSTSIIMLIDDLHSELDETAQERVYEALAEMNLQLFISNISDRPPPGIGGKEFKLFHVEHGTIRPRNFS